MARDSAWTQRVAIVTGGASGLGKGLCETLARAGAKVVIADIDQARASELGAALSGQGLSATASAVDVTDAKSIDALVLRTVEEHGRVDYFFNNAGIIAVGELQDIPAETLRRVIEINLLGTVYGTLAAYRQMRAQGSGHIVNIASMYALMPNPLSAAYVATKHGLSGLTQSVIAEAEGTGVNLTLVCPGYIATNLLSSSTYSGDVDSTTVQELVPFSVLDVQTAVDETLAAVRAKKRIAVFPAYVRFMWLLQRLSPRFFLWVTQRLFVARRKQLAAAALKTPGAPSPRLPP